MENIKLEIVDNSGDNFGFENFSINELNEAKKIAESRKNKIKIEKELAKDDQAKWQKLNSEERELNKKLLEILKTIKLRTDTNIENPFDNSKNNRIAYRLEKSSNQ